MNSLLEYIQNNQAEIYELILQHISLCGISLLTALLISLVICFSFTADSRRVDALINFFSFLRLIPGVAILVVTMPLLGVGFFPAVVSLTLLSIPSILIQAYSGIKNIPPSIIESADGLGLNHRQILFRIQLPMSLPFIILGLRTAVVDVITVAAIASLMGAGGLGRYILTGLVINDFNLIIIGGGCIMLIALSSEGLLGLLQRKLEKRIMGV